MILIKYMAIAIVSIILFTTLIITILISSWVLAEVIIGLFKRNNDEEM